MNKTIIGIIIGVCVTITALSVWLLFSMNSRISQLENFAVQVVQIINNPKK